MKNETLFTEALKQYRKELEEYTNRCLDVSEVDISIDTNEHLIRMALEEATERLRLQNERYRKGWKRENDGQQDHNRKRGSSLLR